MHCFIHTLLQFLMLSPPCAVEPFSSQLFGIICFLVDALAGLFQPCHPWQHLSLSLLLKRLHLHLSLFTNFCKLTSSDRRHPWKLTQKRTCYTCIDRDSSRKVAKLLAARVFKVSLPFVAGAV